MLRCLVYTRTVNVECLVHTGTVNLECLLYTGSVNVGVFGIYKDGECWSV